MVDFCIYVALAFTTTGLSPARMRYPSLGTLPCQGLPQATFEDGPIFLWMTGRRPKLFIDWQGMDSETSLLKHYDTPLLQCLLDHREI